MPPPTRMAMPATNASGQVMAERIAKGLQWEKVRPVAAVRGLVVESPAAFEEGLVALKRGAASIFRAFAGARLRLVLPAGAPAWMRVIALKHGILCVEEKPAAAAPHPLPYRRPWRRYGSS